MFDGNNKGGVNFKELAGVLKYLADLQNIFRAHDLDNSGYIDQFELTQALTKFGAMMTTLNSETVRLIISLFYRNNKGGVNFNEFASILKYFADLQNIFRAHDLDNSSYIDQFELTQALTKFGYRCSDQFYYTLIPKFDRLGMGVLAFDDFILCYILLQRLTNVFMSHDNDRDGWIQVPYEVYLSMVCNAL